MAAELFPFEKSKLKLGSGGSGAVFLGRSSDDADHLIAIKKRFIKRRHFDDAHDDAHCPNEEVEHNIMKYLGQHPNTMGVRGIASFSDCTYFAMDLMASDIAHEIKAGLRPTISQVAHLMHEMLVGLQYVHSCNVVHRDIKPSNILLARDDSRPLGVRVVIGDFGVAHFATTNPRRAAMNFRGTRLYQPPEVLLGHIKAEDSKSIDVWAAGCTMFDMLARKPAFSGVAALEMLRSVYDVMGTEFGDYPRQTKPCRLPNMVQMDAETESLLLSMMSLDPAQRPTATEALQHPFFAKHCGCAPVAPLPIKGYGSFDSTKLVFKPVASEHALMASDMSIHAHHDHSGNSSHGSSIHLSAQRGHHLTFSNLRTNAQFNSTHRNTTSTSKYGLSSENVPPPNFNSPMCGRQLGFNSCSPTPARRELDFDGMSPAQPFVDLNSAQIDFGM